MEKKKEKKVTLNNFLTDYTKKYDVNTPKGLRRYEKLSVQEKLVVLLMKQYQANKLIQENGK
jgi:hypothetical protein